MKKWKFYNIVQILLLKQNTNRKNQVDKIIFLLEFAKNNKTKNIKLKKLVIVQFMPKNQNIITYQVFII